MWYLCKWKDLQYDQATWETDDDTVPELMKQVDEYFDLK